MDQPTRFPWGDFPDVLIHASESLVKNHHAYPAAKAGGTLAAVELIAGLMSASVLSDLRAYFDHRHPRLLSVHAEESGGINAIPEVMAATIAGALKWPYERQIVQTNVVSQPEQMAMRDCRGKLFSAGPSPLVYTIFWSMILLGRVVRWRIYEAISWRRVARFLARLSSLARTTRRRWPPLICNLPDSGGNMDTLKIGGDNVLDSTSTALPPPKSDISAALQRVQESLSAWKKLVTEGVEQDLHVKLDTPPHLAGKVRMLSIEEQAQLLATKVSIGDYVDRILKTKPHT